MNQNSMSFPLVLHTNWLLLTLLTACLIICLTERVGAEDGKNVTNVGAIIDANSPIGKQQKFAMEIAAEIFNNQSDTHELVLHFRDSGRDPFRAASAVEELVKQKQVQVIVGMETWPEAALVADYVRNRYDQIPVISFAAPSITPPLMQNRWPFLMRMATNGSAQMKCIADIVSAYKWRRVVVVYEDDGYGGDVGLLSLLADALQRTNSKIENHLVLPRVSSTSNSAWADLEDLLRLPTFQSRVFIVLQSSLPTLTHLFRLVKKMGFVGADSAWIISESITSLLDPQGNSDMEGTLGIKTYHVQDTSPYVNVQNEFQRKLPEEDDSRPGIYALRAYDVVGIITHAISRTSSNTTNTSLQEALATTVSNYKGLSGKLQFKEGEVLLDSPRFRIINIVDGKTDRELNFWTPGFGFSESLGKESDTQRNIGDVGRVIWPGNPMRVPKGWGMPTAAKPMKIGIPANNKHFSKFVTVGNNSDGKTYNGFCIQLFYMVLNHLKYHLPYEFEAYYGTYSELVEAVYNKTFDAAVGDITVLTERMEKVEFTQPYMESGMSMIILENYDDSTWMFMKPFKWKMWVVSGALLIYTTLIVWFLERSSNPEFEGPVRYQIVAATWFTFSSLFFAHRERVYTNYARVVFMLWLFVVLILNSSYTASLSSMLTVHRVKPNVTIEMLQRVEAKVGTDGSTFVRNYLPDVYDFKNNNIIDVGSEYSYMDAFKSKNISAIFLELPYAQVLMNEFCNGYTSITPPFKFGGLSFIFQKGSPIAKDFSKAILELLENGDVKKLQNEFLTPPKECSNSKITPQSLSLDSFLGLYVICGTTSTLCFLLSVAIWLKKFRQHESHHSNASPGDEGIWNKIVRVAKFYEGRSLDTPTRLSFSSCSSTSSLEYSTPDSTPEHPQQTLTAGEIECVSPR